MKQQLFLLALLGVGAAFAAQDLCPTYTVQPGDGLFQIVAANKKNAFTQEELVATLTKYIGYSDTTPLQANQVIPLPGYTAGCKFVIATQPTWCLAYQVQANDTLATIAQSLGVTENDIKSLNGDTIPASDIPTPGSYLRLPGWDMEDCADPADTVAPCQVYIVKSGDTINQIAGLYKLDASELMKLNNLTDRSSLVPNQPLHFPPWISKCNNPANQKPAKLPSDTAKTCRVAQMQSGQGLYIIATKYGKTTGDLLAVNPTLTNDSIIKIGTVINIDDVCDCTNVVLVGNGNLPAAYTIDKSYCGKAPAGAPTTTTTTTTGGATPTDAEAPTPAPRKALDSPAPAPAPVAAAPAVAKPADAVVATASSGAGSLAPQLTLLLGLLAAAAALF
eukprot:scaffold2.g6877.t1